MKTNKSEFLDSLSAAAEVRRVFKRLMDRYDTGTQLFIEGCYDNQEIQSDYRAMRATASLNQKSNLHREILRFPNQIVYQFLDTLFKDKYGDKWLTDKTVLAKVIRDEELIKPWVINGL
jgi:hypothetical protein